MFFRSDDYSQDKFIKNYNAILQVLIAVELYKQSDLLDVEGTCAGLSKIYILHAHAKTKDEFYTYIKAISNLTQEDILELKNLLLKNKENINRNTLDGIFRSSPNPKIKILNYSLINFIDSIQKTHLQSNISPMETIAANWNDTFAFTCNNNDLEMNLQKFFKTAFAIKDQYFYCELLDYNHNGHAFVIESVAENKFIVYDPNKDNRNDAIILNNIKELKNRIIEILKLIGFKVQPINLCLQSLSYQPSSQASFLNDIFNGADLLTENTIDNTDLHTTPNSERLHDSLLEFSELKTLKTSYFNNQLSHNETIRLLREILEQIKEKELSINQAKQLTQWKEEIEKFTLYEIPKAFVYSDELIEFAIQFNQFSLLQNIINNHYDLSQRNLQAMTPLHLTVSYRRPEIAKWLIENGCDINEYSYPDKYSKGISCLNFAIIHGNTDIAILILNHPNLKNIEDECLLNSIIVGCQSENHERCQQYKLIIKILIEKGLKINLDDLLAIGDELKNKNQKLPYMEEILDFIKQQILIEKDQSIYNENMLVMEDLSLFLSTPLALKPVNSQSDENAKILQDKIFHFRMDMKSKIENQQFTVISFGKESPGIPKTIEILCAEIDKLKLEKKPSNSWDKINECFEKLCLRLESSLSSSSDYRTQTSTRYYQTWLEDLKRTKNTLTNQPSINLKK